MHDPDVVAFCIVRPWPQRTQFPASGARGDGVRWRMRLHHDHVSSCEIEGCIGNPFPWWNPRSYSRFWRVAGEDLYWPPMITIWHREPGGHDALTICRRRYRDKDGKWHYSRGWHYHVHHWRIQVHPTQHLRRVLLTRCSWCGGHSRKGDQVNVSHSWDGPKGHWWQGEPGLFHRDCSTVEHASRMCLCAEPMTEHDRYGRCVNCGRYRGYNQIVGEAELMLASLSKGSRIPAEMKPRLDILWAERRAASESRESS